MHMLVLYGNTGSKMDLRTQGHTASLTQKMLPLSTYTPCIEEHNVHAIIRWESAWSLYLAFLADQQTHLPPSPDCLNVQEIEQSQSFLERTGLTLSITTLGTCIYRFGKKRRRLDAEDNPLPDYHDQANVVYTQFTENIIFHLAQYVHSVIAS